MSISQQAYDLAQQYGAITYQDLAKHLNKTPGNASSALNYLVRQGKLELIDPAETPKRYRVRVQPEPAPKPKPKKPKPFYHPDPLVMKLHKVCQKHPYLGLMLDPETRRKHTAIDGGRVAAKKFRKAWQNQTFGHYKKEAQVYKLAL